MSCGEPLLGAQEDLSALATLKVELLPPFDPIEVKAPLRLGVLWLDISAPDAWCVLHVTSALGFPPSAGAGGEQTSAPPLTEELSALTAERCRDPLGVSPGLIGPSVAVAERLAQEGGIIELPFTQLPSAEVLFGSPEARLGYATVVLFEDLDQNGTLSLGEPKRVGWRGGRGRDDEGEEGLKRPDRVIGASFQSLSRPHQRLVFREGAAVESPFFYPTVGCEAPPKGLSVLKSDVTLAELVSALAPYLLNEASRGDEGGPAPEMPPEAPPLRDDLCELKGLDEPLQLQVEAPSARLQELVCEPLEDAGEEPPEREPDGVELSCVSATELLGSEPLESEGGASCRGVHYWRLVGCPLGELSCEEPRWDMRSNVPSWWPCGE